MQEIELPGFWRYTVPGKDGDAADISAETYVPWFEVYLPDVLTIWPSKVAQPATAAQTLRVAATAQTTAHEVPTDAATSGGIEKSSSVAVRPNRRRHRPVFGRVTATMLSALLEGSLTVEQLQAKRKKS